MRTQLAQASGLEDAKSGVERTRADGLAAKLAEADRAKAAQVDGLRKQLASEQGRSSGLDRDLALARTQLAQVNRDQIQLTEGVRRSDAAAETAETKLREEQARTSSLATEVITAQRGAALQVDDLQNRLQSEDSRVTGLEHELGDTRAQLAQAFRDTTAANKARDVAEAVAGGAGRRGDRAYVGPSGIDAIPRSDAIAQAFGRGLAVERAAKDDVAQVSDIASSRGVPLGGKLEPVQRSAFKAEARVETFSPGPRPSATVAAGPEVAAIHPIGGIGPEADQASPGQFAVTGSSAAGLPDGLPAHVVLRYARDNGPARARAQALRLSLQAQGLDVSDPVGASVPMDRVTYFYGEDQRTADRVAGVVDASRPVQSRPGHGPLPRPGTIEVAIAG